MATLIERSKRSTESAVGISPTVGNPSAQRRWPLAAAMAVAGLLAAAAICESLGWPFLASPLQTVLSHLLDRRVRVSVQAELEELPSKPFSIRFLGGIQLYASRLEIAAPAWSQVSHMLLGDDVALELRYVDLWRAHRGQPLWIDRLKASMLDGYIERRADGGASWQFGSKPATDGELARPMPIPSFRHLQVSTATLRYRDEPMSIDIAARLSRTGGALLAVAPLPAGKGTSLAIVQPAGGLQVNASGHYRGLPLELELLAQGALPWANDPASSRPIPVSIKASVGRTSLVFKGSALDARHLGGLTGRFSLNGPSLAVVGDALGVTLPTTSAFQMAGAIARQGALWRVVVDDAIVGGSRLSGIFTYDTDRSLPLLSGRVGGRLKLVDLGPVVGKTSAPAPSAKVTLPATRASSAEGHTIQHKVLPVRRFDLASLRAMDADVQFNFSHVDLGTPRLEPLRGFSGQLQLVGGALSLRELNGRLGQGRLIGDMQLDGRESTARWNASLRWDGVRLEKWVSQSRFDTSPPSLSGRMKGRASLAGQGQSTAEILASLKGRVRTELHDGSVSHFFVEMAGPDLAQGLGMLVRGNEFLLVQCAVADLVVDDGVLRPRVVVLDTTNSAVWIDGSLSLATETVELRATVMPGNFSLRTLRTPLRVQGALANPEVTLDKGPMSLKLAAAFLRALEDPVAALLAPIDTDDADVAGGSAFGCENLTQRSSIRLATVAPAR